MEFFSLKERLTAVRSVINGFTCAPTMNFKHLTKLGYPGNIYIGWLDDFYYTDS